MRHGSVATNEIKRTVSDTSRGIREARLHAAKLEDSGVAKFAIAARSANATNVDLLDTATSRVYSGELSIEYGNVENTRGVCTIYTFYTDFSAVSAWRRATIYE